MSDFDQQEIRGYLLREKIGSGGFGAVYKAYQRVIDREVAIKFILPQYANQPDFIRRFETEAQIIARLEHLNIVPLYDFWRDPNGAYLVMRWLRGGSLRHMLAHDVIDVRTVSRLLDQITAGLSIAHKRGIVHRDLKPDNILLDEEHNAYLTDFGIAKEISRDDSEKTAGPASEQGLLIGTPAYLSPEQIRAEPLTPRADIYSLGIMLYELLTGELPFHTTSSIELISKHLSEPVPSALLKQPHLPPAINEVIQRATAKQPEKRFPDAISVSIAFRRAIAGVPGGEAQDPPTLVVGGTAQISTQDEGTAITPNRYVSPSPALDSTPDSRTFTPADDAANLAENPYKGLRAFQEADADDFFGRADQIDRVVARLSEDSHAAGSAARFLAVVGPSGSGKSSVVRAGVIPAIRRGALPGSKAWFVVQIVPGSEPLEELEAGLLRISATPVDHLLDQLKADERGLHRAIKRVLPEDESVELVLVIDQFEEVFTLVQSEAARAHFLNSLRIAATEPTSRLRLIITLRADFYDRPLLYPEFGELMRQRTEVVLPLSRDELEQAAVGPAQRAGLMLEPSLIAVLLDDVSGQPGTLPLLQYALTDLYERRIGYMLPLSAYQQNGGVMGALANRAEEIYNDLDEPARALTRQMFFRLVAPGERSDDTRRRAALSELLSLSPDRKLADSVLDRFARFRLLTLDHDPQTRLPTVEVAHEALIRSWDRLHEWLDEARESLRLQQRLAAAAAEWEASKQDASYLLSGVRLDQFATWAEQTDKPATVALNADEQNFLKASKEAHQARLDAEAAQQIREQALERRSRNRLRELLVILAVATVGAIALATYAFNQQQSAIVSSQQAIANASTAASAQNLAQINAKTAVANFTRSESLRLAAVANGILDKPVGNSELAALLSTRALETTYSPEADAASVQALSQLYTVRRLVGQTNGINGVAFSPDGKTVVTAAGDGTVRLWDAASGTVMRTFSPGTNAPVLSSVAFSPDGKTLLTGSKDNLARLWNVESGQVIQTFTGHTQSINAVAFSPDGTQIVTASLDKTARIWDVATGKTVLTLSGHDGAVQAVAFSSDGKTIVTGSLDQTARLWDAATANPILTLTGHDGPVTAVAISPDGKTVLTGSSDKTARLWDAETGKLILTYSGHADSVTTAAFSPDGKKALTGSYDGSAQLWDVQTGSNLRTFTGHLSWVTALGFSPDGNQIITGSDDDTARIWDARLQVSPRTLNVGTGPIWSAIFTPDGKYVLTAGEDTDAHLWDFAQGIEKQNFQGHDDTITSAAFSPDGKTLLTASYDKSARLWEVASGSQILVLNGHTDYVLAGAFSPDGKTILTGSADKTAILWQVSDGSVIRKLTGHTSAVTAVAFSPDGKTILTGSADKTAILWDAQTGAKIRQFSGHDAGLAAVAFSPDGKTILTGSNDKTAILWNVETGAQIRRFTGHTDTITAVTFSPDGRFVLTASYDKTARLWNVETGAEVRRLTGHTAAVSSVAFSPDGKMILTGSFDNTARTWDTDPADWIRYICTHISRDFTLDEKAQYSLNDQQATCPSVN